MSTAFEPPNRRTGKEPSVAVEVLEGNHLVVGAVIEEERQRFRDPARGILRQFSFRPLPELVIEPERLAMRNTPATAGAASVSSLMMTEAPIEWPTRTAPGPIALRSERIRFFQAL
jgi:hypothetical protein